MATVLARLYIPFRGCTALYVLEAAPLCVCHMCARWQPYVLQRLQPYVLRRLQPYVLQRLQPYVCQVATVLARPCTAAY